MTERDETVPWPVEYRIDREDRVVEVNEAWRRFALLNGGDELGHALGRSLWDAIDGAEVRFVWEELLRRARSVLRAIEIDYRCDAPAARRFMRMRLEARDDGSVYLRTWPLAVEPRDEVRALERRATIAARGALISCAWCRRVVSRDRWLEIEDALAELGVAVDDDVPLVSHGICADCAARVEAKLV